MHQLLWIMIKDEPSLVLHTDANNKQLILTWPTFTRSLSIN